MKPGPRAVCQTIFETLDLDAPPRDIGEITREVIEGKDWNLDGLEKAEAWKAQILHLLERHCDECYQHRRQPKVAFNSSTPSMIQGPCFVEPREPHDTKEQKLRRLQWREYYNALKRVDPREFELLCKGILQLLGAKEPTVTEYRADEGIDFFGKVSFAEVAGIFPQYPVFEESLTVWLVGQAKHYQHTKVATPDIRELVGSVTLGRARAFASLDEERLPRLRIKVCDPVFMLFFATGDISQQGWELCSKTGVVAMDGELLAQFLADKEIGIDSTGGTHQFCQAAFIAWLRGISAS